MDIFKNYSLYFHDDFDGVASGAALLNFLRSKGGDIKYFHPLHHSFYKRDWELFKLRKPAIIVDFYYHPRAHIWFDHHETSFFVEKWAKKFKPDKFRQWRKNKLSCCGFMIDHLERKFNFKFPKSIHDLRKWADIIDSAGFASARQVFDFKKPALKISFSMMENLSPDYRKFLIKELSKKSFQEVAKIARVRRLANKYKKRFISLLKICRAKIVIDNRVAFLDATWKIGVDTHFICEYLVPKIKYAVRITKGNEGVHLSVSKNHWNISSKKIDIGKLLRAKYGGGGHSYAAGAKFSSKREALKAAADIVKFLNRFG